MEEQKFGYGVVLGDGMSAPHSHNHIEINYVENGTVEYIFDGNETVFPRESLVVFWAIYPHRHLRSSKEAVHHWLTIPVSVFFEWGLPEHWIHTMTAGGVQLSGIDNLMFVKSFFENCRKALGVEKSRLDRSLYFQMKALVWAMVEHEGRRVPDSENANSSVAPFSMTARALQIATYIAKNFKDPITVGSIADQYAITPSYASDAFRRFYGVGIKKYLISRRIAHAKYMLIHSDKTVTEVAFECGFSTASCFYEAFNSEVAASPVSYRKLNRASLNHKTKSSTANSDGI